MEQLQIDVAKAARAELDRANAQHGPMKSLHDGHAIIREEVEEAQVEMEKVMAHMNTLWKNVKYGIQRPADIETMKRHAALLEGDAIYLACEAIQVAAMARKFINLVEVEQHA